MTRDEKALEIAQRIVLMRWLNLSQLVAKIQVAVLEAMRFAEVEALGGKRAAPAARLVVDKDSGISMLTATHSGHALPSGTYWLYADKLPEVHEVELRTAATATIPATMFHGAGAYAQCHYCKRYSRDPATLSDRPPACECGQRLGWSGSFAPPTAESVFTAEARYAFRSDVVDQYAKRPPAPACEAWAIVRPDGKTIHPESTRGSEHAAQWSIGEWPNMQRQGFTCRRVTIVAESKE